MNMQMDGPRINTENNVQELNDPKKFAWGGLWTPGPSSIMSFLVWNCRGLANPQTVQFLKEITKQIRPNIIFLSETLVLKNKIESICKALQFVGWFAVDAQIHGGGLALLWKNEGGVEIKGSCNHYIDFEVSCE